MGTKHINIFKKVIKNQNSWVLFQNGTVVIFLPQDITPKTDLRARAIERLQNLNIRDDVVVAEHVGQGTGWVVSCGDDYILNFLSWGDYTQRYERMRAIIEVQKKDQQELQVLHVERVSH